MESMRAVWLLAVVSVAALAPSIVAQQVTLTGTWRHDGGDAEQRRRNAAIERASDDLNVLVRGIARRRLRDATLPAPELTLQDDGDRIAIEARGERVVVPTDGTPTRVSGERGSATMRARRRREALVVSLQSDDGSITSVYRLSEDGERLTLEIRMHSDRLSQVIRYRVTYVRARGAPTR